MTVAAADGSAGVRLPGSKVSSCQPSELPSNVAVPPSISTEVMSEESTYANVNSTVLVPLAQSTEPPEVKVTCPGYAAPADDGTVPIAAAARIATATSEVRRKGRRPRRPRA